MSKEGDEADYEIIVEDEIGDEEENNEPTSSERRNEKKPPDVEEVSKNSDTADAVAVTPDVGASSPDVVEPPKHVVVREEIAAVTIDQAQKLENDQKIETVAETKNVPPPPSDVNEHKEADIEEIVEIPKSFDQKEIVQSVSEEDSADEEVEEYVVEDSIEDEEKDDQTALVEKSIADSGQETNGMKADIERNGDLIDNVQNDAISDESSSFSGDMEQYDMENVPVEQSFNESVSSMSDSIEIVDDLSKNEDVAENETPSAKEVTSDESKLVQHNENANDNKNGEPTVEKSTESSAATVSATANKSETNENKPKERPVVVMNIRKEPLTEVMLFVDSLTQLSFDWKKYSCFFCKPCHVYVTSTAAFENHINEQRHQINLVRWKMINDLNAETMNFDKKLQDDIIGHKEFIVGLDKTIAIKPNGRITCFVCMLCNFVCSDMEFLITHLGAFDHIDNFMEYVRSHLYKPTTCCSLPQNDTENMREVDDKIKNWIINEAKSYIRKNGQCKIRLYSGQKYRNWITVDAERRETEDDFQRDQIGRFLTDWQSIEVRADVISAGWSAANGEYGKMNADKKQKYIGLQYLVELWAPTRRAIAVWYCVLCDSLVIDWTEHCSTMQHVAVYLKKDYKEYVFDCAVLEADNEEQMRQIFEIAKTKVLQFEGCQARVKYVLQILELCNIDTFVAINAKIAKVLSRQVKNEINNQALTKRQRQKERRRANKMMQAEAANRPKTTTSEASNTKNTKLAPSSKLVPTDKDSKSMSKQNGDAKRSSQSLTKSSDVTPAKRLKAGAVVSSGSLKGKENRNDDKASQRLSTGSRDSPKGGKSPSTARRRRRSPSRSSYRRSRSRSSSRRRSRSRQRSAGPGRRSSGQSQLSQSSKVISKKTLNSPPAQQTSPKPKSSSLVVSPEETTLGPFVLLTPDDLVKFTDLLKAVGVDLGRQVLIEDLQLIRGQFPEPEAFDALLGNLLKRNKEEIESVAKMDNDSS